MALRWSGDDAFDDEGRRVASIGRFRDVYPGALFSSPFWQAFVVDDMVMLDGEPARWPTDAEARAAAERAYAEDVAMSDAGWQPRIQNGPRQPRSKGGLVIAQVRAVFGAWRPAHRRRGN
jgi:hypothetical protein